MILSTDQTGRTLQLKAAPERIISLVPSQTELLADLGLDRQVVGITKFCIHPEKWFKEKTRVGGTKNIKIDLIRTLKPDLIIANKEENDRSQIEELSKEFPVWTSDISDINSAIAMIRAIGELTDRNIQADTLATKIVAEFDKLKIPQLNKTCLYLIWREPFMAAGTDTFIHSTLQLFGLKTLPEKTRYPELSASEIESLSPDLIFLSSEPYPFKEDHIRELSALSPKSKIFLVDGELFSWYGSRMLKMPEYFLQLYAQIKLAL